MPKTIIEKYEEFRGADWPAWGEFDKCSPEILEEINEFILEYNDNKFREPLTIYDVQGREKTIVVIGDSWTWGDSLENREEEIYGRLLADRLNYNLLNWGYCGGSNYRIVEKLRKYAYGKLDCYVVTLTETGRDLTCHPSELQKHEQEVYDEINSIRDEYNLNLYVFRNFTRDYPGIVGTQYKTWIEILGYSTPTCGPVSGLGYDDLQQDKEWFIDQTTIAQNTWDFLDASPLNHKKATRHPTAEGHKLWADYVYGVINE